MPTDLLEPCSPTPMLPDPRPMPWILVALVPLVLASCSREDAGGKKTTGSGAKAVAEAKKAPAPEAPKFKPGEKGYVAPPDGKATPPLIDATKRGNLEAVVAMLDTGVDPNAARGNGLTALHIAAGENMLEIARALLAKGADPAAKLEGGITPMHMAAASADGTEMVKLLLKHKAPLELKDSLEQQTPLCVAAALGRLGSVRALLEAGAELEARNDKGRTPLILAAVGGHLDVVHLLLDKGAAIDARETNQATALHAAAQLGRTEVAAALLARGAAVDLLDSQKKTPLHLAAFLDRAEIADLLLANGANILLHCEGDNTPAQLAAYGKHLPLAKHLSELEKAAGGPGLDVPPTPQKSAGAPKR